MPAQNPKYLKPAGCAGCSLETIGFGYAPPSGPLGARLTAIGEALGYEEAVAGEPFYGSAGGVLSRIFHRAGIDRQHVRIGNIVSCRPPNDFLAGAPWEQHAIAMCRQYLQPLLDSVPDNGVVMPLGATALDAILGLAGVPGVAVKDFHGTVTRSADNRYWIVPSYHPSHLQRGAMNLLDVVTQDVRLAHRISQSGFTRSTAQLIVDPVPDVYGAWVDRHLERATTDPDGTHLSLDTEFPEKMGADESEVERSGTLITRVNVGNDSVMGMTVPYRGPYIGHTERLLSGLARLGGWVWLWNKYVDWDKLRQAGHTLTGIMAIDGMWVWHYLQSDLPRGLGFVAPMASDFGAWKHWGKDKEKEGVYAAADGLQNWRVCMWLLKDAIKYGIWDVFMRDWHERDQYVLRPATEMGVPINRVELQAFHEDLQRKLGSVLARMKETAAQGVLKPKLGYAKRPMETCWACDGEKQSEFDDVVCPVCQGQRKMPQRQPPASILGKPKKGGGEAKMAYMLEGVTLVQRNIDISVRVCLTCHAEAVGAKHRCPRPAQPKRPRGQPVVEVVRPTPNLEQRTVQQARYFWQLPFNPDAPQQILAYLAQQGIDAPIDRKKGRATTNKKAMEQLKKEHADDPFFQLEMDWKAVQKVDSTYAVGTLSRLDADDRVHPELSCKPSTLRDSCTNPNLQNVVADKAGPDGLASGFRRCIEARDQPPPSITPEEFAAWQAKWGTA
jgi:DNA polymerase